MKLGVLFMGSKLIEKDTTWRRQRLCLRGFLLLNCDRLLGRQAYYSIMSICFLNRASTVKSDSSYSFQFNEMARPAGLEPAAFRLEGTQYKTLSAASGVAYEEALHLSRP
jgi:hypothetical protein